MRYFNFASWYSKLAGINIVSILTGELSIKFSEEGKKNNYAHSNVRWSLKLILKIPAINYFSSHAGLEKKKSNERKEKGREKYSSTLSRENS